MEEEAWNSIVKNYYFKHKSIFLLHHRILYIEPCRDSRKIQRIPEEIRYPHKALENRVGLLNS